MSQVLNKESGVALDHLGTLFSNLPEILVSSSEALAIAEADGSQHYKNLEWLKIEIALETDGWHIEYRIRQYNGSRFLTGGGPHYIIDSRTGEIVSKKYYQ